MPLNIYPLAGCEDGNVLDGGLDWLDVNQDTGDRHYAVDLNAGNGGDADLGLPIYCPADGWVRFRHVWNRQTYGEGTFLGIEHDNGNCTRYLHLDQAPIGEGKRVTRGAVIATCGKTGYQRWAHLHFEVLKSLPASWWQWPGKWSQEQAERVYLNPHVWLREQKTRADIAAAVTNAGVPTMKDLNPVQRAALGQLLWDQIPYGHGNAIADAWLERLIADGADAHQGVPLIGEHDLGDGAAAQIFQRHNGQKRLAVWEPSSGVHWRDLA